MPDTITYYYSHISPWSYLGHERLAEMARRHGVEIDYVPVSTRLIFPKTGGVPLAQRPPARQAYRMAELRRWPKVLGVPLTLEPKYFPADDQPASRLALAAKAAGHSIAGLSLDLMRACWVEDRDIADPETLVAVAGAAGLDGRALLADAGGEQGQLRLEQSCEQALADGCFGVPWYSYRGEPFWGQDRLDLLDRTLSAG
ncbi:MAG: 2-hydroxychromene-2-carboxylate isomerase [Ectothiorhodospiraceae bacterium]|nr:2-hydroxychromene-2-carboxylate isomerase [Ectothiorhodospiraceae bacterium]MCH8507131.1 2-hydroxychromene-2-carboxylate isomerase [Ectothiorhodospiraceae bacterium]